MARQIVLMALLLAIFTPQTAQARETDEELVPYVEEVCELYEISSPIVEAIIFYESSWNANAVSSNGVCIGLMQVNPKAHADLIGDDTDLFDPYQNIYIGVQILYEAIADSREISEALDIYNGNARASEIYEAGNVSKYASRVLKLAEKISARKDIENAKRNAKQSDKTLCYDDRRLSGTPINRM